MKIADETEDGAEQTQQRRDLRDGGEQIQFLLEPRHFGQAGFLDGLAHALAALVAVEDGGFDEARDRAGRGVADGNGLDDVVALEHGAHAVEEFGGIDLRAVAVQRALDEHDEGDGRGDAESARSPAPPLARSVGMRFL